MTVKVGDRICWTGSMDSPDEIREGMVTKVAKDLCWTDHHHAYEDCLFVAYAWPIAAKDELVRILEIRQGLKEAYDDSLKLIMELRNRVSRGEIR